MLKIVQSIIIVFCMTACQVDNKVPVNISFDISPELQNQLHDFRFYIHDIHLHNEQGVAVPLELDQNGLTQQGSIALIDFRPDMQTSNHTIRGQITENPFQAISFVLGVPFELNHANPLTAKAPLNYGEMLWSWQMGYKFLRLDMKDQYDGWSLHLGSTGCHSHSRLRPPQTTCDQPNLVKIELKDFNPQFDSIGVNIHHLINESSIVRQRCTGNFHAQPFCRQVLAQFGLNADNGQNELQQSVFHVIKP